MAATEREKYRPWIVWILRILVGALFIVAGVSKAIDLWGFIYKIEEYLRAWGMELPRSLNMIAALALSVGEFMLGAMLALGAYKRVCVWFMSAVMVFMLPLTAYILIADPVSDCGCFGDFVKLSNGATFIKNILIVASLIYLWRNNPKVNGIYNPYIQWIVATLCFIYVMAVAMFGYMVQPLVDFRSFAIGASVVTENVDSDEVEFEFIYSKDGAEQSFSATNLPDSTWTFIDRRLIAGSIGDAHTELVVYDPITREDVTDDLIGVTDRQLIIVIPDYSRFNVAYTYAVNELSGYMTHKGFNVIALSNMPPSMVERWRDLSMADFDMYTAESTVLKELARGEMAAVYIKDGKIIWKRSLSSIDPSVLEADKKDDAMMNYAFDGNRLFTYMTTGLIVLLLLVLGLDKVVVAVKKKYSGGKSENNK